MRSFLLLATAAAAFGLSGLASAQPAAYVATFQSPVAAGRMLSSDRLWSCDSTICIAGGAADTAPQHVCSRLARALGPLASFAVREQMFDDKALAACNAKAGKAGGA